MVDYPTIVGDVRGKGLMIGVELITNSETREPMPRAQVLEIFEDIKNMGVLIGVGGLDGNVKFLSCSIINDYLTIYNCLEII